MNEDEWLAAIHPRKLLDYLDFVGVLTDRKQRLLDCACVRRLWHLLRDESARNTVMVAERYADGFAELDEMLEIRGSILAALEAEAERNVRAINSGTPRELPNSATPYDALSAAAGTAWEYRGGTNPLDDARNALSAEGITDRGPAGHEQMKVQRFAELRDQIRLLRDIFGNPFRPVTFSPSWRTDTALSLARQMYESRDFGAMPILADALQDAGCGNEGILNHCRDEKATHVRGCWVVDLVLDRE
jgi:hypothetical protein